MAGVATKAVAAKAEIIAVLVRVEIFDIGYLLRDASATASLQALVMKGV
jgi:hypothetical protein